jgi:diguanylate cyclase (GGDEF)-like protein/PAS domain S-box-containing protein
MIRDHHRQGSGSHLEWDVGVLKLAEEQFHALFETAPDAMVIVDESGRIVLVNSQTERLFGFLREELIGERVELLMPARAAALHPAHRTAFAADPHTRPMGSGLDLTARRKDGSEFPVEISLSPMQTDGGILISSAIRDVTERKRAQDALAHQARHDPLTGLPNRILFLDRLEHALARASRSATKLAVIFLDLDDFKLVNDTLGHEAGDLVLVALTPRLCAVLRPGDTVARFGGDEYVILCEDLDDEADAIRIAARAAEACSRPIAVGDHEHLLTASAGVAISDSGQGSPSDLLRDADAAMYRAKARGKGRVEVFDEGMRARLMERIAVESDLRQALRRGQLRVFYQPMVSLTRDEIVGVEALLRWEHPTRGLLEPAEFMQIAESSGVIVPIGEWVIEQACRQAVAWRAARPDRAPIKVSVNLSPRQVARSDIADAVQRILERTGLDPSLLNLEITESVLLEESDAAVIALRRLKSLGVGLILDDFGTGYSSLSYLRRFSIDALKIDPSFVGGLGRGAGDVEIVNAVLSMARALDVGVIAEGVETADQLERLRSNGCVYAQGYLFSKPVSADRLAEFLHDPDSFGPRAERGESGIEELARLVGRIGGMEQHDAEPHAATARGRD